MKIFLNPMEIALKEAQKAFSIGEVPVGAVITDLNGIIISKAHNLIEKKKDATAHAEILAIQKASIKIGNWRLNNCSLYVTLEPCSMCASAIEHSRIKRLYFGCDDLKRGAVNNGPKIFNQKTCHHKPEIYDGLNEKEARYIIQKFFKSIR